MAGSTPVFGWPYPQPGDRLADGATVIGNFINELEDTLVLPLNTHDVSTPFDQYPPGFSSMTTSGDNGWPYTSGHVVTFSNGGTTYVTQLFIARSTLAERQRTEMRHGYNDSDGVAQWSPFRTFASRGIPTAQASGQVSGTAPSGGGVVALNVSFPAERFQGTPRVIVCPNATTLPNQVACSVSNLSPSGCTIYLYRQNATGTSIAWHAVYGVD